MKKTIKKKNPQDSTSRNVKAANRKIALLKSRILILEGRVDKHYLLLNELQDRLDAKPK